MAQDASLDIKVKDGDALRNSLFASSGSKPRTAAASAPSATGSTAQSTVTSASGAPSKPAAGRAATAAPDKDAIDEANRKALLGGREGDELQFAQAFSIDDVSLEHLDITTHDIEFDVDALEAFLHTAIVRQALEEGIDLRKHSALLQKQLQQTESNSVDDYVKQASSFAQLKSEIEECDAILASFEALLSDFRTDLGSISNEIKSLQDQSLALNQKIKNRSMVGSRLSTAIDTIGLPEAFIERIQVEEVNAAYAAYLDELGRKLAFAHSDEAANIRAIEEGARAREALRIIAVSRVRDFLLEQINSLKKPNTNIQIQQQSALAPYAGFYEFLLEHDRAIAEEVREAYTQSLRRIYAKFFRTYIAAMFKLHEPVALVTDLLGAEKDVKKRKVLGVAMPKMPGMLSSMMPGARDTAGRRENVFELGVRKSILNVPDSIPLVPTAEEAAGVKYPYEVLFRSIGFTVLDAATAEFLFCTRFFGSGKLATAIFDKTFAAVFENLEEYLTNSFDGLGIALCARVASEQRRIMAARECPVMDEFYDRLTLTLWPRFKAICDRHVESLEKTPVKSYGTPSSRVHYVTRRFSDFVSSILVISYGFLDELMGLSVEILARMMDKFLRRMAEALRDSRDQDVFMLNQLHVIVSDLERVRADARHVERWHNLQQATVDVFVQRELANSFKPLMKFVAEVEPQVAALANAQPQLAALCESKAVERVARTFATSWHSEIESLAGIIMGTFEDPRNSFFVLRSACDAIGALYTSFNQIVDAAYRRAPFQSDMITPHKLQSDVTAMLEQYARTSAPASRA